jgi:prepilin-type N-terminal cleavage/methylation domain-containing protein
MRHKKKSKVKSQRYKVQRGFTLVELLIYIGMLSILFTVLTQIFGSILDAQLESEATSSVQQDGRFILSRLTYDTRRAQAIVIPAALGSQSTSLQLTISGVNYTYGLSGGNLELTNNLGINAINSGETTVSGLNFTRIGNSVVNAKNTIQIEYTVTSKVVRPKGQETKDFKTTIGIR